MVIELRRRVIVLACLVCVWALPVCIQNAQAASKKRIDYLIGKLIWGSKPSERFKALNSLDKLGVIRHDEVEIIRQLPRDIFVRKFVAGQITWLEIWDPDLSDTDLEKLAKLPKLEILVILRTIPEEIRRLRKRTRRQYSTSPLAKLSTVRYLRLNGLQLSDADMAPIAKMKLTKLEIQEPSPGALTNSGLSQLCRLKNLTNLSLSGTKIDDKGLVAITNLTKLQELTLLRSRVTGVGISQLKSINTLSLVMLSNSPVDPAGLKEICKCSSIEQLYLRHTKITDESLKYLRDLPRLETLYLDSSRLTDAGLGHLKSHPQLDHLSLDGNLITDAGFSDLQNFPRLRHLSLQQTSVTRAGIEKFKKDFGSTTLTVLPTR
jgi:Leucine-rich repeat (LRR) protein